jgi:hypothetical protein
MNNRVGDAGDTSKLMQLIQITRHRLGTCARRALARGRTAHQRVHMRASAQQQRDALRHIAKAHDQNA